MLQNRLDKMTNETEKSTLQKEITELSDLFPDIDSKVSCAFCLIFSDGQLLMLKILGSSNVVLV